MKKFVLGFFVLVAAIFISPQTSHAAFGVNYTWSHGPGTIYILVINKDFETTGNMFGYIALNQKADGSGTWDGKTVFNSDGSQASDLDPTNGPFRLIAVSATGDGLCCAYSIGAPEFSVALKGAITVTFPEFQVFASITPHDLTVENNSNATFVFNLPGDTPINTLFMKCPAGVTVTFDTLGDVCNSQKSVTLANGKSGTFTFTVHNTTSAPQNVLIGLSGDYESEGDGVGALANLTIKSTPTRDITVVAPNGGEKWNAHSGQYFRWSVANGETLHPIIKLYPYITSCTTSKTSPCTTKPYTIMYDPGSNIKPGITSYGWSVVSTSNNVTVPEGKYLTQICDYLDQTRCDIGDGPFTIFATSTITVTYPNGGETLIKGKQYTLSWRNKLAPPFVKLQVGGNGKVTTITSNLANIGYTYWTVPPTFTTGKYLFYVFGNNSKINDTSDGTFDIVDPPVVQKNPTITNTPSPTATPTGSPPADYNIAPPGMYSATSATTPSPTATYSGSPSPSSSVSSSPSPSSSQSSSPPASPSSSVSTSPTTSSSPHSSGSPSGSPVSEAGKNGFVASILNSFGDFLDGIF